MEVMAGVLALALALAGTPLVMRWARRRGWVAQPQADRWHERPTALMGGLAIYAAGTGGHLLAVGTLPAALWTGGTLLAAVGWADDRWGVAPLVKLAAQVAAALLLLRAGYAFGSGPLWLTGPLTVVWVVGITNAVNLLDNMDGLAAGVVAIATVLLVLPAGGALDAALWAVAGAALGFLVYNVKPARIFMGDCGSLFLGFAVAALSLTVVQAPASGAPASGAAVSGAAAWLAPVVMLAVPLFDTTLVTVTRLRAGRPVWRGGRDHSSHRLVRRGCTERQAVFALYAVAAAAGLVACTAVWTGPAVFYALAGALTAGLAALGVYLSRAPVAAVPQAQ